VDGARRSALLPRGGAAMSARHVAQLVGLALAAAMIVYHHFFNRDAIVKRALAKLPRARLADAAAGRLVKAVARLEGLGEPLVAPLSKRRCVHFDLTIEQWESSGRSGRWEIVAQERTSQEVLVRDSSGTALVRPDGAEIAVLRDENYLTGPLRSATPELKALLEAYGQDAVGWLGLSRKLRYREGVFEAGEHVAIQGVATRWADDPAASVAGLPEGRRIDWVFATTVEAPLRVSDDPVALFAPKRKR
jgi:hypothetical protein